MALETGPGEGGAGDVPAERRVLARQVRQRLESLRRAGLSSVPIGPRPAETASIVRASAAPAAGPRRSSSTIESAAPAAVPAPAPEIASARPPAQGPGEPAPAPIETAARKGRKETAPSVPSAPPSSLFESGGFDAPPVPPADRPEALASAAAVVARCVRCPQLVANRTQTVYGAGSPTARLMFIGEAPGADEDRAGRPFVGRSGQLLTDMITKGMGLTREEVYISNTIKCRPPNNRPPLAEEVANCSEYLEFQLSVVRPELICLLGKTAAVALLGVAPDTGMKSLRQRWHSVHGIKTLVTYHPSFLLRSPAYKKDAWEDLQLLMKELGIPVPRKS